MDVQDYYLILYDISDDKRRNRLFKTLRGYGASYQYSVFEARLDRRQAVKLRAEIEEQLDTRDDRVALIRICESCRGKALLLGTQTSTICQNVIII